jgi:hypothetical protein
MDDTYPHVYEQLIDRLACALGGKATSLVCSPATADG